MKISVVESCIFLLFVIFSIDLVCLETIPNGTEEHVSEKSINETNIDTNDTVKESVLALSKQVNESDDNENFNGNDTVEIEGENFTSNISTENSKPKLKFKCIKKNLTEDAVSAVQIVNASTLISILSYNGNISSNNETKCALVLFYAKWCHFSAAIAPHFNALGRLYPHFDILAFDAGEDHSLNAKYGIFGVPSVILFSSKRPAAKLNDSRSNVHDLAAFLKQLTGFDAFDLVEVNDKDFKGPLPCIAIQQTDYVLILSWVFLCYCFIYGFSKSSFCQRIIESIQINWQEAEAQHEHAD